MLHLAEKNMAGTQPQKQREHQIKWEHNLLNCLMAKVRRQFVEAAQLYNCIGTLFKQLLNDVQVIMNGGALCSNLVEPGRQP